ncbi:MAG TPA: hypothetical protein VF661_09215 [Actinomycetales bacterium]|jgi:hypothetical protein
MTRSNLAEAVLGAVLTVALVAFGVLAIADGGLLRGALYLLLALGTLWSLRRTLTAPARQERSRLAAASWTPERVAGALGPERPAGRTILDDVRALRTADRELSLADATTLARAHREGGGPTP